MNASAPSPFLPHLNAGLIEQAYRSGAGRELDSKMGSPESSSALVANAFGFFLDRPRDLPAIPGTEDLGWPASSVALEACVRFPWSGGRHPWLDVLIETKTHLIGVESKRYEPFRSAKKPFLSTAYLRDVWGQQMGPIQLMRDALRAGGAGLDALDATQLVKHSFGLRTESHRRQPPKPAVLVYLYAEPDHWTDGRAIGSSEHKRHAEAIERYAVRVEGAEVGFRATTYRQLLECWKGSTNGEVVSHAAAVHKNFSPF